MFEHQSFHGKFLSKRDRCQMAVTKTVGFIGIIGCVFSAYPSEAASKQNILGKGGVQSAGHGRWYADQNGISGASRTFWREAAVQKTALPGVAIAGQGEFQSQIDKSGDNACDPEGPISCYRLLAEQGDNKALFMLGYLFENGSAEVKQDLSESLKFYTLSAEKGNALALEAAVKVGAEIAQGFVRLGKAAWDKGGDENNRLAVELFRKAANAGNADAQAYLGQMYLYGAGVTKNIDEAIRLYGLAIRQNNNLARVFYGRLLDESITIYMMTDLEKNKTLIDAVSWYRLAAKEGDPTGQLFLASMYERGRGVSKNLPEAVNLFTLSANQGNPYAQHRLGYFYEWGAFGVPGGQVVQRDLSEAVKWYRRAADFGLIEALINLGRMHESGLGVARNYSEAVKFYRIAAGKGDTEGQYNLGRMYEEGKGVVKNNTEALKLYKLASRKNIAVTPFRSKAEEAITRMNTIFTVYKGYKVTGYKDYFQQSLNSCLDLIILKYNFNRRNKYGKSVSFRKLTSITIVGKREKSIRNGSGFQSQQYDIWWRTDEFRPIMRDFRRVYCESRNGIALGIENDAFDYNR
jgi:TPR repeat protein